MSTEDIFGDASYSSSEFFKVWKMRQPDEAKGEVETRIVRRLFGPMKGLLKEGKGKWYQYYALHYGYEGVNPKDASKKRSRPFGCLFRDNRDTKEVLEACEKCDDIDQHVASRERAERSYIAEKRSEGAIKELLKPMVDWERKHNRDRKYYFCGMDPATEEYGVLLLTPKAKNRLLAVIAEHRKKYPNLDPLKPREGVLFEFIRTGRGFNIVDDIKIVEEGRKVMVEGEEMMVYKPKAAPLSDNQARKAFEICPDLIPSAQEAVKFLSHEQIKQLVACDGDPEQVDRIWGLGTKPNRRVREEAREEFREEASSEQKEPQKAAPEPISKQETDEEKEDRELEEKWAARQAKKAAEKSTAEKKTKEEEEDRELEETSNRVVKELARKNLAAPSHEDLSKLSDADFLKHFGGAK